MRCAKWVVVADLNLPYLECEEVEESHALSPILHRTQEEKDALQKNSEVTYQLILHAIFVFCTCEILFPSYCAVS